MTIKQKLRFPPVSSRFFVVRGKQVSKQLIFVMADQRPAVLVTGVSTGIGYGLLEVLTAAGYHVFGSVRKQADAERLLEKFGQDFTPLLFDVTNEAAVKAAAKQVNHKAVLTTGT